MQIDDPRALMLRLIVGELLARRGTGPLARRHFAPARKSPASHVPRRSDLEDESKP